jgi:hypothetical protein
MYQDITARRTDRQEDKRQYSSLVEAAETMRDNAVDLAREKMGFYQQEADLTILLGRRDFVEYFKYALAKEVAQMIATYDQRVQAVYLFEETANPDSETEDYLSVPDLTIHLLAKVTSASAALEAFISSIDRALTEILRDLPSDRYTNRTSFLHVIPVTDEDIKENQGYAVLLSSFYARPLRIWQRA